MCFLLVYCHVLLQTISSTVTYNNKFFFNVVGRMQSTKRWASTETCWTTKKTQLVGSLLSALTLSFVSNKYCKKVSWFFSREIQHLCFGVPFLVMSLELFLALCHYIIMDKNYCIVTCVNVFVYKIESIDMSNVHFTEIRKMTVF